MNAASKLMRQRNVVVIPLNVNVQKFANAVTVALALTAANKSS